MSGFGGWTGGTATPVTILVGNPGATSAAAQNVTRKVPLETVRLEESGTYEKAVASFEIVDIDRDIVGILPESKVRVIESGVDLFRGYIRSVRRKRAAISRIYSVQCEDVSSMLDLSICVPAARRTNGESDKARISWLLAEYGGQFIHDGSADMSQVQQLRASMPDQSFGNVTLRQAIERVIGAASESGNYYVDSFGRLHVFDEGNPETFTAPFDVVSTRSPTASQVVPEGLEIEYDSSALRNRYRVRGKASVGQVLVENLNSIDYYGARSAFVDAPDADTLDKAIRVGQAALRDTKDPIPRGTFKLSGSSQMSRNGKRWASGQTFLLTDDVQGWVDKQYRITRLTWTYLSGDAQKMLEVEFGGNRRPIRVLGGQS